MHTLPSRLPARPIRSTPRPHRFGPSLLAALPVLLAAGCSYDPPAKADHASAAYRADLDRCDREGAREAAKVTGATPWTFLKSPFTYPPLKHARMRECMTRRGYAVEG